MLIKGVLRTLPLLREEGEVNLGARWGVGICSGLFRLRVWYLGRTVSVEKMALAWYSMIAGHEMKLADPERNKGPV